MNTISMIQQCQQTQIQNKKRRNLFEEWKEPYKGTKKVNGRIWA